MDLKSLLELIVVGCIINDADSFSVEMVEGDDYISFTLLASEQETGKLIGRQGYTISALRTLMRCAAAKRKVNKEVQLNVREYPALKVRHARSQNTA